MAWNLLLNSSNILFDTFYHAIALENSGAVLVTTDERYLRAAQDKGRIMHVKDWV